MSQLNVKTFVVLFIEISMTNEFLVYISVKSIIVDILRMRDSYKRFVKTWIRFANPWIRIVS